MTQHLASIVKYEKPYDSVQKAVELSKGLKLLPTGARVFIKPNIVWWTTKTVFPKWGVITTSRVVEDMVAVLKAYGIDDIVIGEGMVIDPRDMKTPARAFDSLGYSVLNKRYGVKCVDIHQRPFKRIGLAEGVELRFNTDILESDFVVNLPVLKTHVQTVVSLGIKNLKGVIDMASRKRCHHADAEKNLHYWVSFMADPMPPMFTMIDGIYANERGPSVDGRMHRSNLLIASSDVLTADFVGASALGYAPGQIAHLAHAARRHGRPLDMSDVEVVGEPIESVANSLEHSFPYNEEGTLPLPLSKMGIQGLTYRQLDLTLCTYCASAYPVTLAAVARAWKGKPFENVEVLSGKVMKPTPGMQKTILLGKCIYQLHKDSQDIGEMYAVKECPPRPASIIKAFHRAGIPVEAGMIENMDLMPGFLMKRYKNKPEFKESFFQIE